MALPHLLPSVTRKGWMSCGLMYATMAAWVGLLSGCDASSSDPALSSQEQQLLDRLQAPVITQMNALGSPAYPGSQLEVSVSAYSPLERDLSYAWSVPDEWDLLNEDNHRITLQAPYETALKAPVTVTVSDGTNSRTSSLDLATKGPAIEQFSMVATPNENQIESIDFSVTAFNRDGGLLSYQYAISGLAVGDNLPEWQWQAETASAPGFYDTRITVSDEHGLSSKATSTFWLPGISNWTSAGADRQNTRRSGANAQGPTSQPTDIWTYGSGKTTLASPAIGPDGMIYAILEEGDDFKITAVDPTALPANRVAWEWSEAALFDGDYRIEHLSNIVLGANNDLFVVACLSNDNCYIFRLDTQAETDSERLTNGRLVNDISTSLPMRLFIDQGGVVYLANSTFVKAFRFGDTTSREYWSLELEHQVRNITLDNNQTLYTVQASNGASYMLSALNSRYNQAGSPYRWREELVARGTSNDFYLGMLTASDGTLYALTSSHLTAIEVNDRSTGPGSLWTYPADRGDVFSYLFDARSVLIRNQLLYLMEGDPGEQKIMVFDLSSDNPTPQVIWQPEAGERILTAPAMGADGTLFIYNDEGGNGAVVALDSDPETPNNERQIWKSDGHTSGQNARLLVGDGVVVVTSHSGVLLLKE